MRVIKMKIQIITQKLAKNNKNYTNNKMKVLVQLKPLKK